MEIKDKELVFWSQLWPSCKTSSVETRAKLLRVPKAIKRRNAKALIKPPSSVKA